MKYSDKEVVQEISKNRFDLFVLNSRHPNSKFIAKELEYYSNFNKTILGTILFDYTDKDFSCVILCRDENKKFKAFDVKTDFKSVPQARKWIKRKIKDYTRNKVEVVEQGDSEKGVELFNDIVVKSKMHPYYILLRDDLSKVPAKSAIIEIANHFGDIDGNFVDQFQSINGFDSRLWEIYLFAFLTEEGFLFDRSKFRPDFVVNKDSVEIGIEAVIVARPKNNPPSTDPSTLFRITPEEVEKENSNDMPLRFGSALYSKMTKKYWEDVHLKDKPLILAIADFHADQSMLWSFPALLGYLYGYDYPYSFNENNEIVITPKKIEPYRKPSGELIDSGFFFTQDSENVSAILFSAVATISKFSRMGIQAGFGVKEHRVLRMGAKFNHESNAFLPEKFAYEVNENCNETWGEGVNLFHNPNAKYPIDIDLFPNVAHHFLIDEHIHSMYPEFHPYFSINQVLIPKSE